MALPCSLNSMSKGEGGNDNAAAAANAMDEIRSFHILGVCVQTTFCHDHPPLSLTFCLPERSQHVSEIERTTYQKYLKDHHVSIVLPIVHYCHHPFVVETWSAECWFFHRISYTPLSLANATKDR